MVTGLTAHGPSVGMGGPGIGCVSPDPSPAPLPVCSPSWHQGPIIALANVFRALTSRGTLNEALDVRYLNRSISKPRGAGTATSPTPQGRKQA